ncbi:MAG: FecR domain-containing protein [Rikenellaceae bacterium]|jgi:ferric-dicitrate binding protein FerR (iron transport regulator)|nr:FecR domain-containing protein [Rikenellaceae bacterium]
MNSEITFLIERYMSGDVTRDQRHELKKELAALSDDRLGDILSDVWESYGKSIPVGNFERLTGRRLGMALRPDRHPAIRRMAVAVALVALAAVGGWRLSDRHIDGLANRTNTIMAPAGQRVNVTLPDGTGVWLNSLSQLSYPAIFTGGERRVCLTGEGFFDVAHDSRNPFIIETERYDVRALGTKFDLMSSPSTGEFFVSLVEGKVQVSERANSANSIILTSGYEARLADGGLIRQEIPNTDVFRWRDGLFCFRNKTLGDLLELFERNYDIRIVYDAATLPKNEISGKFRTSDGIFHILRTLQHNVQFSYRWDEENNVIYIVAK